MNIFYSKVGNNRGRKRIWIEGKRLAKVGFNKGVNYSATLEDNLIRLTLDKEGIRKVSGKVDNERSKPIIDLCSSAITQFTKGVDKVKVTYNPGEILIVPFVE